MEKYIVLHRCEDEVHITVGSASGLKKDLAAGGQFEGYEFIKDPGRLDLENFPSRSALIIKGEVVVPKAKKVVTEYEV